MKKNISLISKKLLSATCLTSLFSICLPFSICALEVTDIKEVIGNIEATKIENKIDINQIDNNVVINWGNIDLNRDETLQFHQPSSNSIALNRVISKNASYIDGQLIANGKIIIINQNGIMFGHNSRIDVNGIIATTVDIDNEKFLKNPGHLHFDKPGNIDASIINNGHITAKDAGLVGLIAPNVINNGAIVANSGRVELASGNNFTIDMYGDKLVEVSVSDKLKSQLISNNGLIEADGGKVIITAAAGKEIVNSLIEIKGEIKAAAIAEKNGEIIIYAEGSNAVVNNTLKNKGTKKGSSNVHIYGKLDVSGKNPGERGGKITITGDNVALLDGAFIDARGHSGLSGTTAGKEKSAIRIGSAGGDIKIGGDYLGQGETPSALNLYVDQGALILNDSINSGDAGRTIFWSDDTEFYGNVYARALGGKKTNKSTWNAEKGGNTGDGGFVETSGHKHLEARGYVDTTASNGETGTYLLDPTSIKIYGNFAPNYVSTDGSINLAPKLKLWLDASDSSYTTLSYQNLATTVTGTVGHNTLTTGSVGDLVAGAKIRLNDASTGDTYTIQSILITPSTSTLTLTSNLTANYSGAELYAAYVSSWGDESGNSYNATQDSASANPLWLENQQNGKSVFKFDGSNDKMSVDLSFLNDASFGHNGVPHTNIFTAQTTTYGSFYYNSASDGGVYEGFEAGPKYRMDYMLGDDTLDNLGVDYGSQTPSAAFNGSGYNVVTYKWLADSPRGAADALNTKYIYANTNLELYSNPAGTIGPHTGTDYIGGNTGAYWGGKMGEILMYTANLPEAQITLLNQYESAKWNIPLSPPGSGSSEAEKAMSAGSPFTASGYSVFTTGYLARLSNSANIDLYATSNITLDFKGAALTLADDKSFTIRANGGISSSSSGSISTSRSASGGNIDINAGGTLDIANIAMQASNGGTITLSSGSGSGGDGIKFNPDLVADAGVRINYYVDTIGTEVPLSIIGTAANKVYDATTSGNFLSSPSIASPAVLTGTPVLTFANKNVGTGKALSLSGVSIDILTPDGYDPVPATYRYTKAADYTANITKAPLTVKANNQSITYGQSPVLTYSYTGLVGSDTSTTFTGSLGANSTKIGQNPILENTLSTDGNYDIEDYIPGTLTVLAPKNTIPNSVYTALNNIAYNNVPSSFPSAFIPNGLNSKNDITIEYTGDMEFDPNSFKKPN